MPSELDFTTVARAANRLKVPTTDPELPGLITAWSQALAEWLGYEAHLREGVEESAPSQGGVYLWLRSGAVRRVLSVAVHGVELPASAYHLHSPTQGCLVHRAGGWPFTGTWTRGVEPLPLASHDTGAVVVRFDAGWRTPGQVALALEADPASTLESDLPPVLEEALLITLTAWYRRMGQDVDVTSKGLGSASVGWGADSVRGGKPSLPLPTKQLAKPYYKKTRRKQS